MKLLFTALLLLLCCGLHLTAYSQERIYVVQYDEFLGRVDLSTGQINSHVIPLGAGCNDVIAGNTRLFVTNSLLNTVQEIDPVSESTVREIPIVESINPYSAAWLNDDTLLVTNWVSDDLSVIRLSLGRVIQSIPVGSGPEGIVVHGEHVFVCLTNYDTLGVYGPGTVMVLNRHTLEISDSIRVGVNPQTAAVDSYGRLHVVCTGDYVNTPGRVDVIDAVSLETVSLLEVGGTPGAITFAGDYAVLAAGGWGAYGYVYRYRLSNLQIMNSANNPIITGAGAMDVAGLSDGSFIVSCFMTDQLERRSADGNLITRYPVSDGPGQMVLYPPVQDLAVQTSRPFPSADIVEAYPNPFNSSVRIRLVSSVNPRTYLSIYNVYGCRVAQIEFKAANCITTWDGRDASGMQLPSGSYFLGLTDGMLGKTSKLVIIR